MFQSDSNNWLIDFALASASFSKIKMFQIEVFLVTMSSAKKTSHDNNPRLD